jgi:hypothetical protein
MVQTTQRRHAPKKQVPVATPFAARPWSGRIRWFAAEFLVVVTGILVAFWLQAWWDDHQSDVREQAFLAELLTDAKENGRRIETAIVIDSSSEATLGRLTQALRSSDPLPPTDSLISWFNLSSSQFRPLLGTLGMVHQVGGMQLLPDDEMRFRVAAFAGEMHAVLDQLRLLEDAALDAGPQLYPAVDRNRGPDGGPDFASMRGDPELVGTLRFQRMISRNRVLELRHLGDQNALLVESLERARGER